jgi:hypothetical protein
MKLFDRHFCWFIGAAFGPCLWLSALSAEETTVAVDFDHVIKSEVNPRAAGINLCWLLDSDLHRKQPTPMKHALRELKVGTMRFPYGHLADNYLWHTPPYDDTKGGIRPRIASRGETPGTWSWAVKLDGSMPAGMDFDEYIALCEKLGAKPVVCVNALSFKYPGGPTYEELKAAAVAWVKYAMKKNHRVAYWEIGNEVEHKENGKLLPMTEYVALYEDFARAMKAVDPSAQIGPGILSSPAYYRAIAKKCPELVSFASVHQYMWSWQKTCPDYAGWRDCQDTFIKNIEKAAKALAEAGLPQAKLLVTETGVTGGVGLGQVNNTYKALWCFEVLMNELSHPSVAYAHYWGTHSPWDYQGDDVEPATDAGLALRLLTNARTPTGEIIRLVNGGLLEEFVATERVQGRLRCYAMRSRDGGRLALFLLNKDDQAAEVVIPLGAAAKLTLTQSREFTGKSPDDVAPTVRDRASPQIKNGTAHTTLVPLSVTVIQFAR